MCAVLSLVAPPGCEHELTHCKIQNEFLRVRAPIPWIRNTRNAIVSETHNMKNSNRTGQSQEEADPACRRAFLLTKFLICPVKEVHVRLRGVSPVADLNSEKRFLEEWKRKQVEVAQNRWRPIVSMLQMQKRCSLQV